MPGNGWNIAMYGGKKGKLETYIIGEMFPALG